MSSSPADEDVKATTNNVNEGFTSLTKSDTTITTTNSTFPPPKTDKPRPHVCGTCGRSFARLEHLKRHERSHTKEKPFECPQCTRCFARRDLLLRHQQKLHQAGAPSSRPRALRRESVGGAQSSGSGRARKNSVASGSTNGVGVGAAAMRPRANTISHIDTSALNFMDVSSASGPGTGPLQAGDVHSNSGHLPGSAGFDYRGMSSAYAMHGNYPTLPKLETTQINSNVSGGLRTAPPFQHYSDAFGAPHAYVSGSTINPAQLHPRGTPVSAYPPFLSIAATSTMEDEERYDWASACDSQMTFNGFPEQALDGSSSSTVSTASPTGFSDVMMDGTSNALHSSTAWPSTIGTQPLMGSVSHGLNLMRPDFADIASPLTAVPPNEMQEHASIQDVYFTSAPPFTTMSPTTIMPNLPSAYFNPQIPFNTDAASMASSFSESARHNSISAIPGGPVTDSTRHALLTKLSQPSTFGGRKHTQHNVISPISPGFASRTGGQLASLPSTGDLQRYINSYTRYFHPHLPFLHIPTLSFEPPMYAGSFQMPSIPEDGIQDSALMEGGGSLILSMAAIGALYEYESGTARELFEGAKKIMQLYLEERRKAESSAMINGSSTREQSAHDTPLWLVQAMLLNVIFGHECGDQVAADIATNHCASLVSLVRAANLTHPETHASVGLKVDTCSDVEMQGFSMTATEGAHNPDTESPHLSEEWVRWKVKEERKRTLFAVFIVSSLLVTAYDQTPAILNSEITLELPCEESLWTAETAQIWAAHGGAAASEQQSVPFAAALTDLLGASQRNATFNVAQMPYYGASLEGQVETRFKPSTFGCFVLINALHNHIWETRQRHQGQVWTQLEMEAMHNQVEPALKAWQSALISTPYHSLERGNPYSPLAADSIPLLNLAYVRLFVNLSRSREAFWKRDYETMAEELARGTDLVHAEPLMTSPTHTNSTGTTKTASTSPDAIGSPAELEIENPPTDEKGILHPLMSGLSSNRERHLRRAALGAADSLLMSDKLGMSFSDPTARELPIQSAMCTFDCIQVLAEWVATVQERVGKYLGVLGKDDMDVTQVPATILLDDDDCQLLGKISTILQNADMKLSINMNGVASQPPVSVLAGMTHLGYGSKLLLVTAHILEKAAVWPVVYNMVRALETHAAHMSRRVEASLT